MFAIADIDKAIIITLAIGADDAFGLDLATEDLSLNTPGAEERFINFDFPS